MRDVLLISSLFNIVKIAEPLGIGYLAAVTRKAGFDVEVMDPSVEGWSVERTVDEIVARPSKILGISILRDEQKADVADLVELLREKGDSRFVVVGGHAPTIAIMTGQEDLPPPMEGWNVPVETGSGKIRRQYANTPSITASPPIAGPSEDWLEEAIRNRRIVSYAELGEIIDTYMIGESDISFPLLVDAVCGGRPWRKVPGVAYRDADVLNGSFVFGPPAEKPENLDDLPLISRDILESYQEAYPGKVAASINLGRGCFYQCTFCTVAIFQKVQGGSAHRQRSPQSVVSEIEFLHDHHGIDTFNFEDDNFIIKNKRGFEKIHDLCFAIEKLPYDITFSIFARADVVNAELFRHLRDAGMNIVYLGLESVHEEDLEFFHKGVRLSTIYEALETLISLGFSLEANDGLRVKLGFMPWHPLTTVASLRDSLNFVRHYHLPPKLMRRKLLLYSGIPIKEQIRELGLLDPGSVAGWKYRDPNLAILEKVVENYIQLTISRPYRDPIRTVQKALRKYENKPVPDVYIELQQEMDAMCLNFVDEVLDMADSTRSEQVPEVAQQLLRTRKKEFRSYLREADVEEFIKEGFILANLPEDTADIFRQ